LTDGLDGLASWPGSRRAAGWRAVDGRHARSGDVEEPFALASVTKLLTATAVLVAVQEAVIDLDEPAGPPGSTVRLLLCHASGLPPDGTEPLSPPGRRRIYGNRAYEVLGSLLADRTGMPTATYTREAVLDPLEMRATSVDGSPAHGARATLDDLLRFGGELLDPGRVLAPELLAAAVTPQLPDLDGVLPGFGQQRPNPWGLGFEVKGRKAPHWTPPEASPATFGHFGQSGAFLWVDPVARIACAAVGDHPFGEWALDAWPRLGSAVLGSAVE
jgi:CubicO group peptidase (beta-lactamase class C family)